MTTEHKLTADGAAAVTKESIWMPIDKNTPRGVSMWLINKRSQGAVWVQYRKEMK